MKPNSLHSLLFAGLLLVGAATSAAAQTDTQDQDAHHPAGEAQTDAQAGPAPAAPGEAPAPGMPGGMPDTMTPEMMRMMTPEMMQMMHRMMSQGGMSGMMGQGAMGQGMTGQGRMPMDGGMMMRPMEGNMMGTMSGPQGMMMGGSRMGPAALYGIPPAAQEEMTPERVRAWLDRQLAWHGNARLKIGQIVSAGEDTITAEIVTVDGALVQKLAFNRYPGLVRQITE
jgi:hypothetical protein